MTTSTSTDTSIRTSTRQPAAHRRDAVDLLPARAVGAVLAALVAVVHIADQGGLTALKDPAYVGQGYRLLELVAVVTAGLLLLARARARLAGWVLALGVALGPIIGYVLSRGPGLPGYTEDRGNWSELLGLQALTVEGLLLVLAAVVLRSRRRGPA